MFPLKYYIFFNTIKIQLWHGIGYKKIELSNPKNPKVRRIHLISTIFGFFPPNSKESFLNIGAVTEAICFPVSVPPVKDTIGTSVEDELGSSNLFWTRVFAGILIEKSPGTYFLEKVLFVH